MVFTTFSKIGSKRARPSLQHKGLQIKLVKILFILLSEKKLLKMLFSFIKVVEKDLVKRHKISMSPDNSCII